MLHHCFCLLNSNELCFLEKQIISVEEKTNVFDPVILSDKLCWPDSLKFVEAL